MNRGSLPGARRGWFDNEDAGGFDLLNVGIISATSFQSGNGSAATPAYSFASDLTSGMYRSGGLGILFAAAGIQALQLANNSNLSSISAMTLAGTQSISGANSGTINATNPAWILLNLAETINFDSSSVTTATWRGVSAAGNVRVNNGAKLTTLWGLNFSPQVNALTINVSTAVAAASNGVDCTTFAGSGTLSVTAGGTASFPSSGTLSVSTTGGSGAIITYTGKTTGTPDTFTGCTTVSGTGTFSTGGAVLQSGTVTEVVAVNNEPLMLSSAAGDVTASGLYIPDAIGYRFRPGTSGLASAHVKNLYGAYFDAKAGGNVKAQTAKAVSVQSTWANHATSGGTAWGLALESSVNSYHVGKITLGASAVAATWLLHVQGGNAATSGIGLDTSTTGPTAPASSASGVISVYKGATNWYLLITFNDAGTTRYRYMQLNGTSATWTHATTLPT